MITQVHLHLHFKLYKNHFPYRKVCINLLKTVVGKKKPQNQTDFHSYL